MVVTLIFLAVLIGGMVIGMPIAQALVLTGVALMWHLDFFDSQLLAQNLQAGFDNFPLLAVPFFILAGELMNAGGLSRRIIDLARARCCSGCRRRWSWSAWACCCGAHGPRCRPG